LAFNSIASTNLVLEHYVDVNNSALVDGAVLTGVSKVHLDGLDAVIQPNFMFRVTLSPGVYSGWYTVTACSALTSTDADVWFTPESEEDWADDLELTIQTNNVLRFNNATDWEAARTHVGKEFIYTYHSPIGYYWQELGGTEETATAAGLPTVGYGGLATADTSGTYDVADVQWVRLNNLATPVTVTNLTNPENGQMVTISCGGSAAITIDHSTADNEDIRLRGGEDTELDTYDTVTLQYQPTGRIWREITRNIERQNVTERQSSLTSGQVLDLYNTPRTIITAPGSGYAVVPVGILFWLDYNYDSTPYTVAGQSLELRYTNAAGALLMTIPVTGFLDQSSDQPRWLYPLAPVNNFNQGWEAAYSDVITSAITPINAAVVACMSGSNVTAGNSPLNFRALYRKIKLSW
jgi:hypothetical protein